MMPAGSVNAWRCSTCSGWFVAVHIDDGVTPVFLGCRVPKCGGRMASLGYPPLEQIPADVFDALGFEWHKITNTQLKRARRERALDVLAHVEAGGLVLRPLTPQGREIAVASLAAAYRDKGKPT